MNNNDYMTIGELAKKVNVSVRTIQYYDKEGILKPTEVSKGGRRLYTNKDRVKLLQILSMKYLGFSLGDIKEHLVALDTPEEVIGVLEKQELNIREKIETLNEALEAIGGLKKEIRHMNSVDFSKYARIIELLRMKNDLYWVVKHFDEDVMQEVETRFDEESAMAMQAQWERLCDEIIMLIGQGIGPESDEGQKVAEEWWQMVMAFTDGNLDMLPELMKFNENKDGWDDDMRKRQEASDEFIGLALSEYLQKQGVEISMKEEG